MWRGVQAAGLLLGLFAAMALMHVALSLVVIGSLLWN